MRYHHTKNKGDLGSIMAMADMTAKGWSILLPLTEHAAFDFVAYIGERFLRVQAKYRCMVDGVALVALRSVWTDRHGTHTVPLDRGAIDLLCIYVPEDGRCFYVDPKLVRGKSFGLRFAPTLNNNSKRVTWAKDHLEIPSTVQHVRAGEASGLVGWGWLRQSAGSRAA